MGPALEKFCKQGVYNDVVQEFTPCARLAFSQWQGAGTVSPSIGESLLPRRSLNAVSNSDGSFSLLDGFVGDEAYYIPADASCSDQTFFDDYDIYSDSARMGLLPNSNMFVYAEDFYLYYLRTAETAKFARPGKIPVIQLLQDPVLPSDTTTRGPIVRRTSIDDHPSGVNVKTFMYNGVSRKYKDYTNASDNSGNFIQVNDSLKTSILEGTNPDYEIIAIEPLEGWSAMQKNFFLEATVQGWDS